MLQLRHADGSVPLNGTCARAPVAGTSMSHREDTHEHDSLTPSIAIASLPGRGRGLVATQDLEPGPLFEARAFGFSLEPAAGVSFCLTCLQFDDAMPVHCAGCDSAFCSDECQSAASAAGHELCCGALGALRKVSGAKFKPSERAAAAFLLRSFARRAAARAAGTGAVDAPAEASTGGVAATPPGCSVLPAPSFEDAQRQCEDHAGVAGYDAREAWRQRVLKLCLGLKRSLVNDASAATRLLRSEPCNSYYLRDDRERPCGWAMFPQASWINHSCLPNVGCVAVHDRLRFEALVPIKRGEELTQCYLTGGDLKAARGGAELGAGSRGGDEATCAGESSAVCGGVGVAGACAGDGGGEAAGAAGAGAAGGAAGVVSAAERAERGFSADEELLMPMPVYGSSEEEEEEEEEEAEAEAGAAASVPTPLLPPRSRDGQHASSAPCAAPCAARVATSVTASWGFDCACGRCAGTADAEAVGRFDAEHLCGCGSLVPTHMVAKVCRCHAHNRLGWRLQPDGSGSESGSERSAASA